MNKLPVPDQDGVTVCKVQIFSNPWRPRLPHPFGLAGNHTYPPHSILLSSVYIVCLYSFVLHLNGLSISLSLLPLSLSLLHTHTTHSISYNNLYFVFSTQRCFTSCLASLMYSFLYSIKGIFKTNFCEILSFDFTFSMKTIYILFCS